MKLKFRARAQFARRKGESTRHYLSSAAAGGVSTTTRCWRCWSPCLILQNVEALRPEKSTGYARLDVTHLRFASLDRNLACRWDSRSSLHICQGTYLHTYKANCNYYVVCIDVVEWRGVPRPTTYDRWSTGIDHLLPIGHHSAPSSRAHWTYWYTCKAYRNCLQDIEETKESYLQDLSPERCPSLYLHRYPHRLDHIASLIHTSRILPYEGLWEQLRRTIYRTVP